MPAFRLEFEPVVKPGENIAVQFADKIEYYLVEHVEPLQPIVHDFGSIAAETEEEDKEVEGLYMPDGEIGQYRFLLLDDFEVEVKQPKAKSKWTTEKVTTRVTYANQWLDPTLAKSELFVFEDEKVYFDVKNPTKVARTVNRALFFGFRLKIKPIPKPPVYTTISVEVVG